MSEAFKWEGSAPEAASATTAGLNQEADRAEVGGSHTGMWGGVHGSAGPAFCMYDRDRLSQQREWLCDCVSVLMCKQMYVCACVCFLPVLTFAFLKCFFLVSLHLSVPAIIFNSSWEDSRRHPGPFAVWHAPSPCQGSLSLPVSVSLSSLGPASCWLTQALRRQVRSTTLTPCKKHKKPSQPPPLFSLSFPITATLLCLSLDGFVEQPWALLSLVRWEECVSIDCPTNCFSRVFRECCKGATVQRKAAQIDRLSYASNCKTRQKCFCLFCFFPQV